MGHRRNLTHVVFTLGLVGHTWIQPEPDPSPWNIITVNKCINVLFHLDSSQYLGGEGENANSYDLSRIISSE